MESRPEPDAVVAPRLGIAVLTWNGRDLTASCIDTLKLLESWPVPVVIVDNGSIEHEGEWLARHFGYRIAQLPVTWIDHPASTVNPITAPAAMLVDLVRIRLNHLTGKYREPRRG